MKQYPNPDPVTAFKPDVHKIFVGYDDRQIVSNSVLQQSIIDHSSVPVEIIPLVLKTLPIKRQGLTPFTYSRFLVPFLCGFRGKALFLDSDIMLRGDIKELFDLYDDHYAVMVVKNPKRFEWASVMLFNCAHYKNQVLLPEYVENEKNLHGLGWLDEKYIGELPLEWNHLVGYDIPCPDAELVHFTQGTPFHPETKDCEFGNEWLSYLPRIASSRSWEELMGNSVHAAPVKERLARPQVNGMAELGPVIAKGVGDNTLRHGQMRTNMKREVPRIKDSYKTPHDGRLVIVGYAPSIQDTWPKIKEAQDAGAKVLTTSGAHDFLVDKGIIPDFHAQCDPRPEKPQFVQKPQKETTYLLASVVHPDVYEHLKDYNVVMWHLQNKKEDSPVVKEVEPNGFLVIAGSTIGLGAVSLARIMGYRALDIHGMDSSNRDGQRHAGAHGGKPQAAMCVTTESGRTFETTAQMISQAREFHLLIGVIGDLDITLHGDGLLQEMLRISASKKAA